MARSSRTVAAERGAETAERTAVPETAERDGATKAPDAPPGRPMRADAKRNREQLIAAAHAAFLERGSDASLEDIARRACVGVGTLYRHFPSRQALIEAVYVEEVQALCRSAGEDGGDTSWTALVRWFDRFVDYVATKRALVEEMVATLGQDAQVFRTCHDAIFGAGAPLIERAQRDGFVRPDVEFADVIRLVSGITMIKNASPDEMRRALRLALDGLRYRPA